MAFDSPSLKAVSDSASLIVGSELNINCCCFYTHLGMQYFKTI